jgi:diguanylate cyclase (GGDEF)-like protein
VASWGDSQATEKTFLLDECWALRRSKVHQVKSSGSPLRCAHVHGNPPGGYFCVPLVAQGDAFGVLYLEFPPEPADSLSDPPPRERRSDHVDIEVRQATALGERLSLALGNLRLREALRTQSIRDPLTNLFNRRYMEESLERELSRSARTGQPVSLLLLDIDHFKLFNDTFGHQGGDALLRTLGDFLSQRTRGQDVACRYGGEEFAIILSGAGKEPAARRAQILHDDLKHMIVEDAGRILGKVTFSTGIAAAPENGTTAAELLRAADASLYRAKAEGRDRIVVA